MHVDETHSTVFRRVVQSQLINSSVIHSLLSKATPFNWEVHRKRPKDKMKHVVHRRGIRWRRQQKEHPATCLQQFWIDVKHAFLQPVFGFLGSAWTHGNWEKKGLAFSGQNAFTHPFLMAFHDCYVGVWKGGCHTMLFEVIAGCITVIQCHGTHSCTGCCGHVFQFQSKLSIVILGVPGSWEPV